MHVQWLWQKWMKLQYGADDMLASQNIKWASFPYGKLLSSTGKNGEEIGREWLKIEAEKLQRPGHPYTLSLIDF